MAANPETPRPTPPPTTEQQGFSINLGSQSVIMIKVAAIVVGVVVLGLYIGLLAYEDSPYWMGGMIVGVIALALGAVGVIIGNLKISNNKKIPSLNIILIISSIILMFLMPILGSWEDPRTIGEGIQDLGLLLQVSVFALLVGTYIELSHASIRFSQIDDYATSHNLKEFNISAVINNYLLWFAILFVIVWLITFSVLDIQLILSGGLRDIAPQFGYSLEYNSIYSILIAIALVFVPIGIVLTLVFGFLIKSRREIVVKGREDVVARRPDQVKEL